MYLDNKGTDQCHCYLLLRFQKTSKIAIFKVFVVFVYITIYWSRASLLVPIGGCTMCNAFVCVPGWGEGRVSTKTSFNSNTVVSLYPF